MVLCGLAMPYDPIEQPALGQKRGEDVLPAPWSFCSAPMSCIEVFGNLDLPGCGRSDDEGPQSPSETQEGSSHHDPNRQPPSGPASCTSAGSATVEDTLVSSCSSLDVEDDEDGDVVRVIVPPGIKCGSPIRVSAHDGTGRTFTAVVPPGVSPWSSFAVRFPSAASSSTSSPLKGRRRNRRQQRMGEKRRVADSAAGSSSSSPLPGQAMAILLGYGGCIEIGGEAENELVGCRGEGGQLVNDHAEDAIRQFEDELRLDQEVTLAEKEEGENGEWEGRWSSSPRTQPPLALEVVEARQKAPDCLVRQQAAMLGSSGYLTLSSISSEVPRSA